MNHPLTAESPVNIIIIQFTDRKRGRIMHSRFTGGGIVMTGMETDAVRAERELRDTRGEICVRILM